LCAVPEGVKIPLDSYLELECSVSLQAPALFECAPQNGQGAEILLAADFFFVLPHSCVGSP
jgi:hypothetical protein